MSEWKLVRICWTDQEKIINNIFNPNDVDKGEIIDEMDEGKYHVGVRVRGINSSKLYEKCIIQRWCNTFAVGYKLCYHEDLFNNRLFRMKQYYKWQEMIFILWKNKNYDGYITKKRYIIKRGNFG